MKSHEPVVQYNVPKKFVKRKGRDIGMPHLSGVIFEEFVAAPFIGDEGNVA